RSDAIQRLRPDDRGGQPPDGGEVAEPGMPEPALAAILAEPAHDEAERKRCDQEPDELGGEVQHVRPYFATVNWTRRFIARASAAPCGTSGLAEPKPATSS